MKYHEIVQTITGSTDEDWKRLEQGPYYLDRFGGVSGGGGYRLEADTHTHLAVYRGDVDLRLAWGLTVDERLDFGWAFPDPKVERQLVDGFWRGGLVARWTVLMVDGYRCYLPEPRGIYTEPTEPGGRTERTGWKAPVREIALARLLQDIVHDGHNGEFDRYLQRAGITAES